MTVVTSIFYIYLIFLLFFIGLFGTLMSRRNLILFLISMEIIFLSSNLTFVVASYYLDDVTGVIFSMFLLAIAANEIAIGLALLIIYSRKNEYSKLSMLASAKG